METLKSTIKQEKHNHEKTPYVGILQSCPKINNNESTKYTKSQYRITHSADQFLTYLVYMGIYVKSLHKHVCT